VETFVMLLVAILIPVGICFASPRDSETVCESPLCDNRFQQTGLKIEPRRFCSDQCRQQASLIRRVGALLNDLPDQEV